MKKRMLMDLALARGCLASASLSNVLSQMMMIFFLHFFRRLRACLHLAAHVKFRHILTSLGD